jgi:Ca2+-binding RTX toxin-like protein
MAIINDSDASHVIYGTPNDDDIRGNGGGDDIYARAGDDVVDGGAGGDIIFGGRGQDEISGGAGVNDLFGGSGADVFVMSGVTDTFTDDFIGDFQFDIDRIDVRAWGASSIDQLKVLFRNDSRGDAVLDAFYNGYDHFLTIGDVRTQDLAARDFIFSNLGAQDITGTAFRDTLFGSTSGDIIRARGGDDVVLGGRGGDFINGGAGQDDLYGGAGEDVLYGSRGGDMQSGGGGDDTFDYRSIADSTVSNSDLVVGFSEGNDQVDLSAIDANRDVAGFQSFDFIGQANFSGAGELRFEHDGNRTIVLGSTDADASAEFRIVFTGSVDFTGADFIL